MHEGIRDGRPVATTSSQRKKYHSAAEYFFSDGTANLQLINNIRTSKRVLRVCVRLGWVFFSPSSSSIPLYIKFITPVPIQQVGEPRRKKKLRLERKEKKMKRQVWEVEKNSDGWQWSGRFISAKSIIPWLRKLFYSLHTHTHTAKQIARIPKIAFLVGILPRARVYFSKIFCLI